MMCRIIRRDILLFQRLRNGRYFDWSGDPLGNEFEASRMPLAEPYKTMIQVYSVEKTLADCFKYRNKIGMDTMLEALDLYRERKTPKPRKLIQFAKVCRVERVMRPYLEARL